jgi:hypothetical protein
MGIGARWSGSMLHVVVVIGEVPPLQGEFPSDRPPSPGSEISLARLSLFPWLGLSLVRERVGQYLGLGKA